MQVTIFAILLIAALVATAISVRLGMESSASATVRYATVTAAAAIGLWLLVTIAAFDVTTVSNGTELSYSYPSLGALGVAGVGVAAAVTIKGSLEMLNT